jgi:diguanylate cyclase (GGDEF)-like protein
MSQAPARPCPADPRARRSGWAWRWWWLLAGLLLLTLPAPAAEASFLPLGPGSPGGAPLSLAQQVEILEDPGQTLNLAEAQASRFQPNPSPRPDLRFGISRSAFWLRLRLSNPGEQPLQRMLDLGYAAIPLLDFYETGPDGELLHQVSTGTARPFSSRAYPTRELAFPLTLPARSERTYYLRISSSRDLNLPLRLWEPSAFHANGQRDYLQQALYFGIAFAMALFNLLLAFVLRERIYLWYVAFCCSMGLAMAARSGLAQQFLWPESATRWSEAGFGIGGELATAAIFMFLRPMLDTAVHLPRIHRLLPLLAGLHVLVALSLLGNWQLAVKIHLVLLAAGQLIQLGLGLNCALRGQRSGCFFLLAFAPLLVATAVVSLRGLGLLPVNALTASPYIVQIGSGLEMILLALALADRFNTLRKQHAQAQQQLVEHLQSSERRLEARVAERTEELQRLNQRLEALSATDGLTGIANRRRFDAVLASECRRAERSGLPLAVGLLDVDLFKPYNDHYGHQAGDSCLRRVAELMAACVGRSGELVARYGGEEFVFIAPATDAEAALALAQRVCAALQELALPHERSPFGCVTASIGVAVLVPRPGQDPQDLLLQADRALYRAKNQGRNRALGADAAPPEHVQPAAG